ncbi:MAG: hypothetical protein V1858_03865 [Candidatus Gottesmanbacteria bacterium]
MRLRLELILLVIILLINLSFRIYNFRIEYLTKFDPVYWQNRYLQSQWVDPQSKNSIGDDGLYAYAGWAYITGHDPTTLNAEMPPLGKYIIGLSILIFHNQNIYALTIGLLCLLFFYKLNFLILKNKLWSLIPVVVFSFEPLFYQQLRAPYLDTLYLLLLMLTFFSFLKKKFFLTGLFIGLMALTKNSASTFLLLGLTLVGYLFITEREQIIKFILNLPVAIIIFILGYSRYFILGHNLREFLGVQKWILNFYSIGAKGSLGMVMPMFFNHWQTWWNGVIKISEWQITWPVTLVFSILYIVFSIFRHKFDASLLIVIWLIIFISFLSFIPVWPRYFLLILPFTYLLTINLVKETVSNIISR